MWWRSPAGVRPLGRRLSGRPVSGLPAPPAARRAAVADVPGCAPGTIRGAPSGAAMVPAWAGPDCAEPPPGPARWPARCATGRPVGPVAGTTATPAGRTAAPTTRTAAPTTVTETRYAVWRCPLDVGARWERRPRAAGRVRSRSWSRRQGTSAGGVRPSWTPAVASPPAAVPPGGPADCTARGRSPARPTDRGVARGPGGANGSAAPGRVAARSARRGSGVSGSAVPGPSRSRWTAPARAGRTTNGPGAPEPVTEPMVGRAPGRVAPTRNGSTVRGPGRVAPTRGGLAVQGPGRVAPTTSGSTVRVAGCGAGCVRVAADRPRPYRSGRRVSRRPAWRVALTTGRRRVHRPGPDGTRRASPRRRRRPASVGRSRTTTVVVAARAHSSCRTG